MQAWLEQPVGLALRGRLEWEWIGLTALPEEPEAFVEAHPPVTRLREAQGVAPVMGELPPNENSM